MSPGPIIPIGEVRFLHGPPMSRDIEVESL